MADPRYRNGIKKPTTIHLEKPQDYGWSEDGINPETGRMVYEQDGCYLTRLFGPGFYVQNRAGVQYHITDATLEEVTKFVLTDPHILVCCIECGKPFDSRLPDEPRLAPLCDDHLFVKVLLAA